MIGFLFGQFMIGLDKFKKSLGKLAIELSEDQIVKVRDQQDKMAEVFFNMWVKEIRDKDI